MSLNSSSSAQNEMNGYLVPFFLRNKMLTVLGYLQNISINISETSSTLKTHFRANFNSFIMDLHGKIIEISQNRYEISRSVDILDQTVKFHVRFSKILFGFQNRSTHVDSVQSTAPNSPWARRTIQTEKTFFFVKKKFFEELSGFTL